MGHHDWSDGVWAATPEDYLKKMRAELERHRGLPYAGKGSPSSGFLSVFFFLQMCKKVDVYGIATEPGAG